jgi:hypothetical protein
LILVFDAGIINWYGCPETVEIPADLLERAQKATGTGVTATVREGLREVASRHAQRELTKLRGAVKFTVDLRRLREDR